ncbi:MFS transporter, partial [Pseudomonadales bacterium]|nr:MFS transporter [Pseudomonadales bacterium]
GGITTFFLGKTTDFATLCFLFVMLSLWCEGAFWPAVLSAVRKSTTDDNQGKIFGLLEGGRGGVELLQNLMVVGLYTALGYSLFGLELAFMFNAAIMIILGVVTWFSLPRQTLLKSGDDTTSANREVLAGMRVTLRLPEIWLAGAVGFCVYMIYTALPFFLTYLNEVYALPVLAVSIFGIASTSGGRIAIALPSGFIAQRFFGGPTGGMGFGMTLVALFALSMMALPIGPTTMWPAMTLMLLITFTVFFMRPLYFAPFGEMGLPPRFSGSVIAIAAFIIYLPTSFAYLLWGVLLDSNEGATGYRYMFALMAMVAVVGWFLARSLNKRIRNGAAARIAEKIQAMDTELGLQGEEKTLSQLIDK